MSTAILAVETGERRQTDRRNRVFSDWGVVEHRRFERRRIVMGTQPAQARARHRRFRHLLILVGVGVLITTMAVRFRHRPETSPASTRTSLAGVYPRDKAVYEWRGFHRVAPADAFSADIKNT